MSASNAISAAPAEIGKSLYAIDNLNFFAYIDRQFTKARLLKGKHAKSPV